MYRIATKGKDYTKSEDAFRTQLLPGNIPTEKLTDIIKKKKESLLKNDNSVFTLKKKLLPGDRILIYQVTLNTTGTPFNKIYMERYTPKSADYKKSAKAIIDKKMENYWGKSDVISTKTLYNKNPYILQKKGEKIDEKKAAGLGVRG